MNTESIKTVTTQLAQELKQIFGDRLKKVILYGSCAREDFAPDSDIDVMILLEIQPEDLPSARKRIITVTDRLDLNYDVVLAPVVQTYQIFESYRNASVFYQNVMKEGVLVA